MKTPEVSPATTHRAPSGLLVLGLTSSPTQAQKPQATAPVAPRATAYSSSSVEHESFQ